jgi:hypothetical protein
VDVVLRGEQRADGAQVLDDLRVGVEDALARPLGDVGGEATSIVHRREHLEPVAQPGHVVIQAVAGSRVHHSGAALKRAVAGARDRPDPIEPRMPAARPRSPGRGIVAARGGAASRASPSRARGPRAAATTSTRSAIATAMYSRSGCTATAMLAGSVQGVVVHAAAATPSRPSRGAGSGSTKGYATLTSGDVTSAYSTSASASAVTHDAHHCTGFFPRYSSPASMHCPRMRISCAS